MGKQHLDPSRLRRDYLNACSTDERLGYIASIPMDATWNFALEGFGQHLVLSGQEPRSETIVSRKELRH